MCLLHLFMVRIFQGTGFVTDLLCVLSSSVHPFPIDILVLTDSRSTPFQLSILPAPTSQNLRLHFTMIFLSLALHRVVSTEGNSDTSAALALPTNSSPCPCWDHISPLTLLASLSARRHHLANEHTQGFLLFRYFQLMSSHCIAGFLILAAIDY